MNTITSEQTDARRRRAEEEEFEWSTFDGKTICTNPQSNRSYVLTAEGGCTCPDAQYRLRGTGIVCKHVTAFRLRLIEGGN